MSAQFLRLKKGQIDLVTASRQLAFSSPRLKLKALNGIAELTTRHHKRKDDPNLGYNSLTITKDHQLQLVAFIEPI